MNRVALTPPELPGSALAELKQWLGITTDRDDAPLLSLLAAALDVCESFTGLVPVESEYEQVLPAGPGWQLLSAIPVHAISAIEGIAEDGTRAALDPGSCAVELGADGTGRIRLSGPAAASAVRIAVRFTAGLAPGWDGLPSSLRHGLIRLAAHQHCARDNEGAAPLPPASVVALWRPWRRLRVA